MDWDNYMAYKKKKLQATVFDFHEDYIKEETPIKDEYKDTLLEEFEPVVERPRRELTDLEKFGLKLMGYRKEWEDLPHDEVIFEKAKLNTYLDAQGLGFKWLVGFGVYKCTLCKTDGTKQKLQKVNYLDHICKECAIKYQKTIRTMLKNAADMKKFNDWKRESRT